MKTGETELYGVGKGEGGEMGSKERYTKFRQLHTTHDKSMHIVQVTCSYFDTTYVTSSNELYSTGQIHGKTFKKVSLPTECKIWQIYSTFFNIYILMTNGDLYESAYSAPEPRFLISNVSRFVPGGYHFVYKGMLHLHA
jgi:hypothetical protein